MLLYELLLLGAAFERKGWSVKGGNPPYPDLFENVASLLTRLTNAERALCLELLSNYRWVTEGERTAMLLSAWGTFASLIPKETSQIWLAPLMKPRSRSPKSSDAVWRSLEENISFLRKSGFPVRLVKSAIRGRQNRTAQDVLVLVDDFVGTGDTVKAALKPVQLLDETRTKENTYILVISAHEAARTRLADQCRIVAYEYAVRCISDRFMSDKAESAKTLICGISRRLGFKKGELLGYSNCESLITLSRTPNNTLPLFWSNRKVKGQSWPAPFPRENDRAM